MTFLLSNIINSAELLPNLVQIQLPEIVSVVFLSRIGIPIQYWHIVVVIRKDFNEHLMMQVTITENQLGSMQMMEEATEHV